MSNLRRLLEQKRPLIAPLVFNPLSARLAEEAGFKALYLGGGSMGYVKAVTEANLTLTEMIREGMDIRATTRAPLILDGACGWGDPMHIRRTIALTEAAGFAAIEIEDQLVPKRAHHHVGIEHAISIDMMVSKIEEAISARKSSEFVIIARTNAARETGLDEALRRGEAYRRAGADMLFVLPKTPEEIRIIGDRLGGPLMFMTLGGGIPAIGMTPEELGALGYRLIVDPATPLLAAYDAMRTSYRAMAAGQSDPIAGSASQATDLQKALHTTIDLDTLIDIERRTVERNS
ncbi:MAG: isocitrate lyase/PEP mutase family protein [Xanthobacteraceae bacterium]